MSEPRWKKLGLQIKDEGNQGIAHLEGENLSKKQMKHLSRKRGNSDENKVKKPPKKKKVAKHEKPPPPEKDQLVYLKQFCEDKESWKFSKQKQNWVLKHLKDIPEEYNEYLVEYVGGIQGGSRERLVEELKGEVDKWNEVQRKIEERVERKLADADADGEAEAEEKTTKGETTTTKGETTTTKGETTTTKGETTKGETTTTKGENSEETQNDILYIERCVMLLNRLGETVEAVGVDMSNVVVDHVEVSV